MRGSVSAKILLVAALVAPTFTAVMTGIAERPALAARTRAAKFQVCHRTNAIKNPYRLISVAWSSVDPNGTGHDNPVHDGRVFDVNNPVATHGNTPRDYVNGGGNDHWGDIFYAYKGPGNGQSNSNNWDADGQAIFGGATFTINGVTKAACRKMTAIDYIKSEREENPNKPMSEIMDDLDDQDASEDTAIKKSLGGSFRTWYDSCNPATTNCNDVTTITTLIQEKSPSVTTEPPTNVSNTTTNGESATLNGTISPQGQSSVWYFEFDDDSNLEVDNTDNTDVQEVPGTPGTSSSASTVNVNYSATGLLSGTTYYYRTVLVVSNGLTGDSLVENYLYGVTRQFSFGLPGSPTITAVTCGNTTLSVAFTAGTGSGITNYDWSIDGGATWTTRSPAATTSPISLNGLVNGTSYSVSIRPRTSSGTGLDSNTYAAVPCGSPSAVTDPPTGVTGTNARIHGNLTGNGNPLSTIRFVWGLSPTLASSNNTTAANTTSLPGTAAGYPVFLDLTGLTPGATYYYKVVGTHGGSTDVEGLIEQFTVPAFTPPVAVTDPPTGVTGTNARIHGNLTGNGNALSTIRFVWGLSSTLTSGNTTTAANTTSLPGSASASPVHLDLTGLTPGATYYYKVVGTYGGSNDVEGLIEQFTVPAAPSSSSSSSTSTTVPSTVAPNSTNDDPLGRVIGTAWFDMNKDDKYQSNEPLLRGVDVQLVPRTVTGQSLDGRVRKQAYVMRTDSTGAFNFEDLPPGRYVIKSLLPGDYGITQSWDSGGNDDWEVTVTVYARQTSRGDFAAIGDVSSTGCVASATDGTVSATWNGFDQKSGTADDTKFTTTINPDCSFTLDGVPTGKYDVVAKSRSGKVYANSAIRIAKDGGTVSAGRLRMVARVVTELPTTGSSGSIPVGTWAAVLLAGGVATSGAASARRRRAARR